MKASSSTAVAALTTLVAAVATAATLACSKPEPEPAQPTPAPPAVTTAAATTAAATTAAAAASSTTPGAASAAASATTPAPASSGPLASTVHPDLLDPSKASAKAPAVFKAKFTTTKGDFVVETHRDWAPNAADRFYNLVKMGFYDDTRFFRVVDGFMVQFGITGDPAVNAKWEDKGIVDDPVKESNKPGYVTFAQRNTPNSRTTQIFINYGDNARLDGMRFAPFAQVTSGMDVVNAIYKGYGESPNQGLVQTQGNSYLDARFPKLDGIKHAEIVK